jgi:Putative peptidoglycan binding domain
MRVRSVALLSLVGVFLLGAAAIAQTSPPKQAAATKPASSDVAKADPAKDAFLGFSEDERKAAQGALVWLGFYNGVDDGAWGKRTGDAISAFLKTLGQKPDGVLTPQTLAALTAAGQKSRDAVGFEVFLDNATGVQIGAPLRLLQKQPGEAGHSVLLSKDGAAKLDIVSEAPSGTGAGLEPLFKSLSADTGARKVGYKAMKAGAFFVVTGDEDATKFYFRYALGPKGFYRGFELRYPKARAEQYDRIGVAISNAFDPAPAGKPSAPAVAATPTPAASGPPLIATAFVLAPGEALTALTPGECGKPLVAGKAATFGRVDEASGLARLDGDFGAGAAPAAAASSDTAEAFVLSRAPGIGDKSVVEAGRGEWARNGAGEGRVVVSAGPSARGAPVFNLRGEMVGVLARSAAPPRRVSGVNVADPQRVLAGAPIEAFVAKGGDAAGPNLSGPELARRFAPRVLGVTCGT